MWEIEKIPDDSFLYRQAHILSNTHQVDNKRIPNESHFSPDEDGLSVYWDKYANEQFIYCYIALSYKFKSDKFKDYRAYKIYKFPTEIFRKIQDVSDVLHSPVYYGNPAPVGFPNNKSHSLVIYPNDVEIRLKLTDYVKEFYSEAHCEYDVKLLDKEISNLRERLNDTPFHKV